MSAGVPVLLPRVAKLNALPREEFVKTVNILFETAPPLANGLYSSRPYTSYEGLIDQAESCIEGMSNADKVEVINA